MRHGDGDQLLGLCRERPVSKHALTERPESVGWFGRQILALLGEFLRHQRINLFLIGHDSKHLLLVAPDRLASLPETLFADEWACTSQEPSEN